MTDFCFTRNHIDDNETESHRYYLARRTVFEMLRDRAYLVPQSELNRSLQDFRTHFGKNIDLNQLRICLPLISSPSKKILVIFCGSDAINVAAMRLILHQVVGTESLKCVMLILQTKLNSHAKKEIENFCVKVETFQITELLSNITKHVLMPKHEIVTTDEKEKLMKKYHAEDKLIPRMLESDAVVRYYGMEKGQVVKTTYKDEGAAGALVTYRCIT